MRFGIGLSVQHRPEEPQARRFAEHLEQVRLARRLGFASIFASQHYSRIPSPISSPSPLWPAWPPRPRA
jgi:alkanesulfonate monooxygenase SsuD/methylene tetrahydromethanopterin reductase-like flavin-dependent oxidoreductase (luciferase family)